MLLYVQWCRAGSARARSGRRARSRPRCASGSTPRTSTWAAGASTRPAGRSHLAREAGPGHLRLHHAASTRPGHGDEGTGQALEQWQIVNHSAPASCACSASPTARRASATTSCSRCAAPAAGSFHARHGAVAEDRGGRRACTAASACSRARRRRSRCVRPTSARCGSGRYERALLLPEVPAPSTPATLILPAGWFQSGRFVEVFSDRKQVAKLLNLLEKGSDFDRGTIVVV